MRKLIVLALPCLALLGGCTSDSSPTATATATAASPSEKVYVRADGKRLSTHPELLAKLDIDKTQCSNHALNAGLEGKNAIAGRDAGSQILSMGVRMAKASNVMQVCMADRGYVYITVAEAEARADALDAKPAKRKRKLRTAMN